MSSKRIKRDSITTNSEVSPLMQELSSYIARAIRRAPPKPVMERAKLHLVDTFGAMISGTRLTPGVCYAI